MSRSVNDRGFQIADFQLFLIFEVIIDRQWICCSETKQTALLQEIVVEPLIAFVQTDLCAGFLFYFATAEHVIEMSMRVQKILDRQTVFLRRFYNLVNIATRVDYSSDASFLTTDDRAVALQW